MLVRTRGSMCALVVCGAVSFACTTADTGAADGGATPDGGAPACTASGSGTVSVAVTGLPEGVAAKVKITGAAGAARDAAASTTFTSAAGSYTVVAARVAAADPIVRTVYEPKVDVASFCLEDTKTQTVSVTYAPVPTSHKLWATTANSPNQLVAFAAGDLGVTGSPAGAVTMKGASASGPGKSVAFDKDGNLWALGATLADPPLLRFAAADLGASGEKVPDRKVTPDLGGCVPTTAAIAFDPSGALWITSPCLSKVVRVSPERLAAAAPYVPEAGDFSSTVDAPQQLAFDSAGNMWVSSPGGLHFFPAATLAAGQPHTPTFVLVPKAENGAQLPPDALAFDKDGNLWATSFGANTIYKLTPSDLAVAGATKDVVPGIVITVGVSALLESLALDESGGIWLTYGQGKIARLAADQLGASSTAGAPTAPRTVLTSPDVNYPGAMSFYPAPAGLPLYGRVD